MEICSNVVEPAQKNALGWPSAQGNDFMTGNRYSSRYWVAEYLVDKDGATWYTHIGKGTSAETGDVIREVLAET